MTELRIPAAAVDDPNERLLAVYRRQTRISDPGRHAAALRALPRNIAELVELIGGVFGHYEFDLDESGWRPSPEALTSIDLRTAEAILDRIQLLDPRPLTEGRPIDRRFLGVCRDASLLLCSILRAQGVPARLRYGMAHHYYDPRRPMHDHVVVEYWCPEQERWKYADGRMYRQVRATSSLAERFRDDVPRELFEPGAQVWQRARRSANEAFRISGFTFSAAAGRWMARNLLMYDLASLYGWEPLMWDAWGYILRSRKHADPRGALQFWKLDRLARYDPGDPVQWQRLQAEYRLMRMARVSGRVLSCSPVNGRHRVGAAASWRVRDARH